MPEIVAIADAVVLALNAGAFSEPLAAERKYLPRFELPEMAQLHVTVVPKAVEVTSAARGSLTYEYKLDVAIQKRFDVGDALEIDPLVQLGEEIADHFRLKRLEGFPDAVWTRTEHTVLYLPEHMESLRQFTSVITFTFRVIR